MQESERGYRFDCSGREITVYRGVIGLSASGKVTDGAGHRLEIDGHSLLELMTNERAELAAFMIDCWTRYKTAGYYQHLDNPGDPREVVGANPTPATTNDRGTASSGAGTGSYPVATSRVGSTPTPATTGASSNERIRESQDPRDGGSPTPSTPKVPQYPRTIVTDPKEPARIAAKTATMIRDSLKCRTCGYWDIYMHRCGQQAKFPSRAGVMSGHEFFTGPEFGCLNHKERV